MQDLDLPISASENPAYFVGVSLAGVIDDLIEVGARKQHHGRVSPEELAAEVGAGLLDAFGP